MNETNNKYKNIDFILEKLSLITKDKEPCIKKESNLDLQYSEKGNSQHLK